MEQNFSALHCEKTKGYVDSIFNTSTILEPMMLTISSAS